ncbi:MAG: polyhydroxyalkanoate synthesis repressor PhaR, partial [Rickettsiales bacterium]
MAEKKSVDGEAVVIKKYANRRLYNTATSSYVTLEHLCQMVKDDIEFGVMDAKGNDITRSVLTQIIVEEESKGENLLPLSFLRQLIGFYGDNMPRMLLPHYLEYSIDAFTKNQDEIQS